MMPVFVLKQCVVCSPNLLLDLFTTGAINNVDQDQSSTTAHGSFHGTSLSMFQHSNKENEGRERETVHLERDKK